MFFTIQLLKLFLKIYNLFALLDIFYSSVDLFIFNKSESSTLQFYNITRHM